MRFLSLRNCLVGIVLTLVAVPLALFWAWPHSQAMQNEIDEVNERHLLIASNLSAALQRYHRDTNTTFNYVADALLNGTKMPSSEQLLANLGIDFVCAVEYSSGRLLSGQSGNSHCPAHLPGDLLANYQRLASEGQTIMSGVHKGMRGEPQLALIRRVGDRMVIGTLDTNYFVQLGKAIAFGVKGHAVIVDQAGKVLAHPFSSWEQEMRDISAVSAVKRMRAGERGVETFFSPAFKDDMIAGFTAVAGTGWGAMVPQPMGELRETARRINVSAVSVFAIGLLIAGIASFWLAFMLGRAVNGVIAAAQRMAAGDTSARIDLPKGYLPRELRLLTTSFNTMAERVSDATERLEQRVAERTAVAEQALAESRSANAQLVEANKAKSRFLAVMSHELRTPMAGVLGTIELLMKSPLNDKQASLAKTSHKSAQALLAILNDILDFSKLEAGRVKLESLSFDLADTLNDVTDLFSATAEEKSIELNVNLGPDVSPHVIGDQTRIRQVLMNLVGNAIKFTERGKVTVSVKSVPDSVGRLRFEIADTGIGISKEVIDSLFSAFTQADASTSRKFGGTGLGLTICRQLVDLMGGKLGVASEVNKGSVFWFELPLARSGSGSNMAADAQEPKDALPLCVLVAEDNPVNQLIISEHLKAVGYKVEIVGNGHEAVATLRAKPCDLVLMDIQMPVMDGVAASRIIRSEAEPLASVPIIAVTANVSPDDRQKYLVAGMDDVIAKPFKAAVLHTTIAKVLAKRNSARSINNAA